MARIRVLVTEGEKSVRQFMNEILTQNGYDVVEADNVEEGMKYMQLEKGQRPIDVVLCNRQTASIIDRDPLVQFLMQRPPVPVVMVADHADLHYATEMFRQGVVDYLVKPIQANALLDVVRHAIELSAGRLGRHV